MKRSPLLILASTLFIDLLGFGLIIPLIPVYIEHYGGAPWVGGALLACYSVMQLLFAPIWGRMSDRHGRRPLILLSLCGSAGSFLAFGLAPNLAVLFAARVAAGALTAASLPTAQAYVADVTAPEKRAGGMAVLGAAFGLGFALGPALGGVLSRYAIHVGSIHLIPLATPALASALLSLCNFIWAFFMLPESHNERSATQHAEKSLLDVFPSIVRAMRSPDVSAQIWVFALVTFAFTAVESSFSWLVILRFNQVIDAAAIHAYALTRHAVPWALLNRTARRALVEKAQAITTSRIFLIVGLTMIFVQVAVMRGLAHRVGEHRLVVFGAGLLTLTLVGLGLAPTLGIIYILAALISVATGVMNPSLNALITQSAGPHERGLLSGAQQGIGSLARIIAPPINNSLIELNTAIPFLLSSILMAAGFVLSFRLRSVRELVLRQSEAAARQTAEAPQPGSV